VSKGDLKGEYMDVGENMRHFGNIRFAQLTLFVAITAGFLTAVFQPNPPLSNLARVTLKGVALLVTVTFWVMDQRAMQYWHHYRHRAVELEKELGFQQYTSIPALSVFSATNALRLLFLGLSVFWAVTLIWHSHF
jgi:hypothetical protein